MTTDTKKNDAWGGAAWESQADDSPLVKIGDGTGQVAECKGLVTRVSVDQFDNPMYHVLQADGTRVRLCSNTTMVQQMKPHEIVGELVVVQFAGWVTPKKGGKPYKAIEVMIFKGDTLPSALAEAFPLWRKIAKPAEVKAKKERGFGDAPSAKEEGFGDFPGALEDDDDDLPF